MLALPSATKNVKGRRKAMMKSIDEVRGRLTLPQLTEDAISLLDPDLIFPRRVQSAVRNKPLVAALLVAGAGWLVASGGNGGEKPVARPRRGSAFTSPSTMKKENTDEGQLDSGHG